MKEIFYFWWDLATNLVIGALLAYFIKGIIPERFSCKMKFFLNIRHQKMFSLVSIIMCLQYIVIRQIMSQTDWAKKLMYGADMYMVNSRQSIVPIAVSMAGTLLVGVICYKGNRMKLLSLVTAFYALRELVGFTFYSIELRVVNWFVEYYNKKLLIQENIDLHAYQQAIEWIQIVWNIFFMLSVIIFLTLCVRQYKKYLAFGKISYYQNEVVLLLVPELLGLAFGTMIRCILFNMPERINENAEMEWFSLTESYPEMNIMIPCMSLLCIASILLSVKMLAKVADEHEKRLEAEIYQNQVAEMEAHVLDMESVNENIRGMKHDMKNYIADIQALLAGLKAGDENAQKEIRNYVDSMQNSLEGLENQCQTGNPVTDVILGRYIRLTEERKIGFSSDFIYPKHLGIDVFDLSVILNNGLENALEACAGLAKESAYIEVSARQKGRMFIIKIENSFEGNLCWGDKILLSTKEGDNHGYGIKNIKNCVEKYYGRLEIQTKENRFYLTVMLQGRPDSHS